MQLSRTAKHELIALDWSHELEAQIFVSFTDPAGKEYLRISPQAFYSDLIEGWLFHPFNPWQRRFDDFTRRLFEHGLIDELKKRALTRMKSEAPGEFIPIFTHTFDPEMTLKELFGIFLLLVIALTFGVFVFCIENLRAKNLFSLGAH